jgi:DNA-binding transcriptional MerR regulator
MSDTTSRPHLSIGEVLSLLQQEFPDITISKIRFLESQGLLDPERTPSGYRKFYEADIERLRWILSQQRDNFLPLKVIKDRLAAETAQAADAAVAAAAAQAPAAAPPAAAAAAGPAAPTPVDRAAFAEAFERLAAERAAAAASAPPAATMPSGTLDAGPSDVSLTRAELAAASGLAERDLETLESFGLLRGQAVGREVVFDGDALVVARLAAAFRAHGLEPRHLRMFKVAVEREADVYSQVVTPIVRPRNAASREQAAHRLDELASLGSDLRAALLRGALRGLVP